MVGWYFSASGVYIGDDDGVLGGSGAMPCGTPWAGSAGPSAREGWIPEVGGSVRAGAVPGLGIGPRNKVMIQK